MRGFISGVKYLEVCRSKILFFVQVWMKFVMVFEDSLEVKSNIFIMLSTVKLSQCLYFIVFGRPDHNGTAFVRRFDDIFFIVLVLWKEFQFWGIEIKSKWDLKIIIKGISKGMKYWWNISHKIVICWNRGVPIFSNFKKENVQCRYCLQNSIWYIVRLWIWFATWLG